MDLNPFQLLGALVAAGVVLAIVQATETLSRPWRYSLRTLLIAVTVVSLLLGVISIFK